MSWKFVPYSPFLMVPFLFSVSEVSLVSQCPLAAFSGVPGLLCSRPQPIHCAAAAPLIHPVQPSQPSQLIITDGLIIAFCHRRIVSLGIGQLFKCISFFHHLKTPVDSC